MTRGQTRALTDLWPVYGVPEPQESEVLLDLDTIFERKADVVLEIGFGNGTSLAQMAEATPELNFLGIEVHRPGVGSLLLQIEKHELTNLKVSQSDAVDVLKHQIGDAALSRVQVFFPDPWHKKRHHKRRLINPDFIALVARKLNRGGVLHLATDWQPYAEHMLEVLEQSNDFTNTVESYAPKPDYRPDTKYEDRGRRLDHAVFDLVFTCTS